MRNVALAAFAVVIVAYGSGPALDTWVGDRGAAVLVAVGVGIVAFAATAYAFSARERIRSLEFVDGVLDAFETSGIVQLGQPGARLVVDVIDKWARAVGAPRLPAGVWGLRNALADDRD